MRYRIPAERRPRCRPSSRARFELLAQHVIRAIAVVADTYKADKSRQHTFRPDAAVVLDTPRLYRIAHDRASIATLDGRQKVPLGIGGHHRQRLREATKLAEADLVRDHKGRWRLLVSAHYADPPLAAATEALGVDLGRRDIAATTDGDTFSGATVTRVRHRNGACMIALMGANVMRPRGPWLACQLQGS